MQHTQQLFLEALKAALKNEQVEWNNKLEAQEWMDLFRMAEVHQILPMIYEAVYRSPAAGQADPQILAPAKAQMVRTVIMQTQKTGEFEPLYRYLRESGICPLVVKGIVCRNIYPNPDYRISGSTDPSGGFQKMPRSVARIWNADIGAGYGCGRTGIGLRSTIREEGKPYLHRAPQKLIPAGIRGIRGSEPLFCKCT